MLKLSLDALQILDAIDRRGSFAGAGRPAQGALDHFLHRGQLEEDLGVQLFDRVGPRAEPTEADAPCWTRVGISCVRPASWSCGCAGWRRAGRPS